MSLLGSIFDTVDDVTGGLTGSLTGGEGGEEGGTGLASPLTNLVDNLLGGLGGGGNSETSNLLDLDLLGSEGVVELDLLDTSVVVLPDNGGIIESGLLGDLGGIGGGDPSDTGLLGLLDIGGLIGEGGLLDLNGLLGGGDGEGGDGGLLDLTGLLGEILDLLSPDGSLDPGDYTDPDGEIDPDAFDVVLMGTDGRDHFTITEVSTYADGLGDIDVATFARSAADFSFAVGADAALFSDGEEIFYLQNVERVSFFEGRLLFDTGVGENAGVAYRIYQAAFDRTPDNDGLAWWLARLDEGLDFKDLANGFFYSDEFAMTYGTNLSHAEYVDQLYENVLGRNGEAEGRSYWIEQLETGRFDEADVLIRFSESGENVELMGQTIEDGYSLA